MLRTIQTCTVQEHCHKILLKLFVFLFSEPSYAKMYFKTKCIVSILPVMFQLVCAQYIYTSKQRLRQSHKIFDEYAKHVENETLQNLTSYQREIILKDYLLGVKGTRRFDATVRPVREMERTTNVTMVYELYGMLYSIFNIQNDGSFGGWGKGVAKT